MSRQTDRSQVKEAIGQDVVALEAQIQPEVEAVQGIYRMYALVIVVVSLLIAGAVAALVNPIVAVPIALVGLLLAGLALRREGRVEPARERDNVRRVLAGEKGMAVDVAHSGTRVIKWDEIKAVYEESHVVGQAGVGEVRTEPVRLDVVTQDDERIALDDRVADLHVLGSQLAQAVKTHIQPDLIAQFEQGEPVSFDVFSISQDGIIRDDDSLLAWESIDRFVMKQTRMQIYSQEEIGLWLSVELGKVPNVAVLHALLDRVPLPEEKRLTSPTI